MKLNFRFYEPNRVQIYFLVLNEVFQSRTLKFWRLLIPVFIKKEGRKEEKEKTGPFIN